MIKKWTCPTAEQWERFILKAELTDYQELEQHLETCAECRFLIQERRREIEELSLFWREVSKPDVIHLSIHEDMVSLDGVSRRLLAAKGREEGSHPESITLSSSDKKILLRAVLDSRTEETWLYLLADDPGMYSNVLVKPFGSEKQYLSDDKGRINLGKVDWPADERLTAEVQLPRAQFILRPVEDLSVEGESAELRSPGGDRIKVTLSGEGRNRRLEVKILDVPGLVKEVGLKVAVRGRGVARVLQTRPPRAGTASFEEIGEIGSLEIFLFQ